MNEIQAWLSQGFPDYDKGVALFRKYNKNEGLYRTFTRNKRLRTTKEKLVHELTKLATRSDIEIQTIHEISFISPKGSFPKMYEEAAYPDKEALEYTSDKYLYPDSIAKAINKRSQYANDRDKYRIELENYKDVLSPEKRADLFTKIKEAHQEVMQLHVFIKEFEKTGIVPAHSPLDHPLEEEKPAPPILTPEKKEALEKKWKIYQRKRSKNRAYLIKWLHETPENHPKRAGKIKYYKDLVKGNQAELDRIYKLLDK